jgi:tetratricopeptide (TPR) repeat protein
LYITGFVCLGSPNVAAGLDIPASGDDPDALYAAREDLESARRAADIWALAVARDPSNFASAWKLARARYWLGGHAPGEQVREQFELGIAAARQAIKAKPERAEGHFWLAANMGGLAETQGGLTGLKYRSAIRESLERVLAIDAAFQHGSADRALGRWYLKVPRLFGGSKSKSETHLRRSLEYNPHSTASLYFLAETLLAQGRDSEAVEMLTRILEAPPDPDWGPEDREFKRKAQAKLRELAPSR